MTQPRIRAATYADLPRIYEVRHGTAENQLSDPDLVTDEEVAWYLDHAVFLVSEDAVDGPKWHFSPTPAMSSSRN